VPPRRQTKSFSRRASTPELCHHHDAISKNRLAPGNKREAKRRKAHANHVRAHRQTSPSADALSAAARHCRGRARLPALHRGTRHRLLPRWLSPRTGFPQGTARKVFCPLAAVRLELSTLRADRSFCRPTGAPEPPGSGSHSSARGHRIPLRLPKVPSRKAPLVSGILRS
jgi:hypothetical protein